MPCMYRVIALLVGTSLLGASGCTPIDQGVKKSPLHRPQMSPDSVVLDIVWVHCPFGAAADESLWAEIDEQQLPAVLRQRLAQNGFRAGIISGQIPTPLSRLMELKDTSPTGGDWEQLKLEDVGAEQRVSGHHLEARAGNRNQIVASEEYPELALLMHDAGGNGGAFYPKAQGVFALTVFPEADSRVRLHLVPELHYGNVVTRAVGDNGALRMEPSKPRRVFDTLAVTTTLAPGQLLAVTSIPSRVGSLGHQFLTREDGGKRQQKLLLIRIAQTQHQGLFSPTEPLDLAKVNP
jgi:hypothetical protein